MGWTCKQKLMKPIEVRNFIKDPSALRRFAFKQQYFRDQDHPQGGKFPGFRSDVISNIDYDLFKRISAKILSAIPAQENSEARIDMYFQYCRKEDQPPEWVHRDKLYFDPNWVGLIYLTPNPPPNTGTALYRLKEGDAAQKDSEKDPPLRNNYELDYEIVNEYNKLAMYSPMQYHDSLDCFGNTIENSRFFIVFFMRLN